MDDEIQKLRKEVAELRKQIDEVDDWANGIQVSLMYVLPLLLRDHPEVKTVQKMFEHSNARYEELKAHPSRGEKTETAALHESRNLLYRQLALLGVWPDVDPDRHAQDSIQQYRRDARHLPD